MTSQTETKRRAQHEHQAALAEEFETLFAAGREELFEDGMESAFSRRLVALVNEHGDEAIEILSDLIIGEKANAEVASEALRWLGHMGNPSTHRQRRELLEQALSCSSARVRDGAALGLAFLDDPRAIPSLERAVEREKVAELRHDMEQVVAQLRDTLSENAQ